jgi:hypothetical protein
MRRIPMKKHVPRNAIEATILEEKSIFGRKIHLLVENAGLGEKAMFLENPSNLQRMAITRA